MRLTRQAPVRATSTCTPPISRCSSAATGASSGLLTSIVISSRLLPNTIASYQAHRRDGLLPSCGPPPIPRSCIERRIKEQRIVSEPTGSPGRFEQAAFYLAAKCSHQTPRLRQGYDANEPRQAILDAAHPVQE